MAPKKAKAVAHSSISRRGVARTANVGIKKGLAMSTTKTEASSRVKTPRKVAANRKWSEEKLLTSDKSVLINMDLVKLLSHPQAWNCLEESEKREILALLPADIHPEAQIIADNSSTKIPPIPDNFIRYSNNWRDGVRQFQLDLENGRYDPEWLRQAQEARERREKGEFDNFKEREYEQFWGQKQKVFNAALAGESARVRLGTLITEGVIQLGDIWRFYFVFGRGPGRIVIEKEVRIDGIDGVKLTFAVPPGERVFLRSEFNKDRKYTIHEKKVEDVKLDPQIESNPAITASKDQEMKNAQDPSEIIESAFKEGEMKEVIDTGLLDIPASSNNDTKPDPETTSQEVPTKDKEMQADTETERHSENHPAPAASADQQNQHESRYPSVLVVVPMKGQKAKRTISAPEPQPIVKRKRGRPRKDPLPELVSNADVHAEPVLLNGDQPTLERKRPRARKEPSPELVPKAEDIAEPVLLNDDQSTPARKRGRARKEPSPELVPKAEDLAEPVLLNSDQSTPARKRGRGRPRKNPLPEPVPQAAVHTEPVLLNNGQPTPERPITSPSIAEEEIVNSGKAGVGGPVPEFANPELHSRQSSSPRPAMPEDNPTPQKTSIGVSAKLSDTTNNDGSNIPTEETSEVEQDEDSTSGIAKQQTTEELASSQDTNNFITNEMGEIILPNISTPASLVTKILQIDGRKPNGRTANAWKEFRCYRNNQDMGSLFDVRETWFLQHE